MAQIKQLKDTTGNFYPVTHKDAIVGIEDIQVDMTGYATEQWVEEQNYLKEHQDVSNKVDVSDFEEATKVVSATLNLFHSNTLWQTEDTYVKCDKTKTLEEAISGESDIVYFTIDSHQIVLNGVVYSLQDISGKVDVTDFEEYKSDISTTINALNQDLANKESDIQLLQAQVLELQNQISTLTGYYNELENIIG